MVSLKYVYSLLSLLIVNASANAGNIYVPIDSSYKLTFDEEFNGTALDAKKWYPNFYGDGINTPATEGEYAAYDPAQVSVSGGYLHLNLINSPVTVLGRSFTDRSGIVTTREKFTQTFGYYESRIYLPGANGKIFNWPAFWLVGTGSWPATGELDIMEGLSGIAAQTFHSNAGGPSVQAPGDYTGWHIFASLWQQGSVKAYYDGKLIGTITNGVTSSPQSVLLNLATGGCCAGEVVVPSEMLVDYVHIYSNATGAVAVTPQAGYNGPGDDGAAVVVTPTPPPVSTPTPPPVVTPPVTTPTTNLSVSSPANNASVSGVIQIKGAAGTAFVNVAAFDLSNNYAKLSADVAPVNGAFTLSVDTSKLAVGSHKIGIMAFTVAAGQSGGSTVEVDITVSVAAVVVPPVTPPAATNLVLNPGFETGLTSFNYYGNVSIVTSGAYAGSRAAKINSGAAGIEQTISKLSPNTNYVLTAYVRNVSGSANMIGVKNYGGNQVTSTASGSAYQLLTVKFKTGASSTSALIFFYNSNGSGLVDNFSLVNGQ